MPLTEAQQQIARDFARHLASNFRTPAVRSIVTSKTREILPCTFADLRIRTKDKRLISLEPNYPQAWYLDDLHDKFPSFDWRNGYYSLRGVRDDILKPRQLGFSTILLGLMFLDTINTPQTESLCMTDNGDRSEKLFRIIHRMYDRLPKHKQRPKKYSSKREIEYSDIDSIISVGTAGTGHVGRGGTISNLLESERAFWENGDEVEAGLFESVPSSGNIWKETTANGYNEYYQERAREHTGESNFRPIFFSWASHKEYQMEIEPPFTRTPEEEVLAQTHTLSNEQLQWRRQKIRDLNRIPDKPKFDQEYPITEGVAFLHSGNPYFNREMLDTLQEALRSKEFDPILDLVFPKIRYPLLRDLYGFGTFRIYCMPRDDHDYIICADPAQGLNADGRHSKNGAHVLDVQTWEQVAVIDGDWTPGMLGMILNELAWYYNEALVGVHRNNHGHTVLRELIYHAPQPSEEKLGYPMQLGEECTGVYTFSHTHIKGTKAPQRAVTREAGFPETERSKIYMLDALRDALDADPGLVMYDRATVGQLLSYVHLPGGGAGPEAGCAADLVSSLALGAVLLNLNWRKTTRRNRGVSKPMQPLTSGMGKERIR